MQHHITASFSELPAIRAGDTIVLHKCDDGVPGASFSLSVGVEAAWGSAVGWTSVCSGAAGTVECDVPSLPDVE